MKQSVKDGYCDQHFKDRSELTVAGAVIGAVAAGIFVPGPGWILASAAIGGLIAANAHVSKTESITNSDE